MGFSLRLFFAGLQALIDDEDMDDAQKLAAVTSYIKSEREYADKCGQLR